MVISFLGVLGVYLEGSVWDMYNLIVKLRGTSFCGGLFQAWCGKSDENKR
jgi:hypothetical protein